VIEEYPTVDTIDQLARTAAAILLGFALGSGIYFLFV
jgi:hypothetical protein